MTNVGIDGQIFAWQTVGGVSRYFSNLLTMAGSAGGDGVEIFPFFTRHRNAYLQAAGIGLYTPESTLEQILVKELHFLADGSQALYPMPDIVHSTYYAGVPWKNKQETKIKLFSTLHDMIPECFPGFFPGGSPHLQKLDWFEASDVIISVSDASSADLLDIKPHLANRLVTIHHANSLAPPHREALPAAGSPRPYFLYVGTRAAYKNWIQVLKGLSRSLSVLDEYILVFAGGGAPSPAELSTIELLGISGRVHFVSPDDQHLALLYSMASAVLVPSLAEGFSFPLIEALAMDVPVFCSDISVHREVGGGFCTFLSPVKTQEWADAMAAVTSFLPPSKALGDVYQEKLAYFSHPRPENEHKAIYASI
jgi:glycosyltransferase involved in cell wall biosynthesis